jgi:small nuclear ribonucleoprotein (snRNP)-like protein
LGKKDKNQVAIKMTNNTHIWIWLQNGSLMKAVLDTDEGVLRIFDENDNLVLKRTGLNKMLVKQIEECIIKYGAKRLDAHAEPFKFL